MLLQNDKENNLTNGQIGIIVNIASNGAYKNLDNGLTHADLNRLHNTTVDAEAFELESHNLADFDEEIEAEEEKDEDANQRQASHIVTARFGEFDWDVLREYNTLKMIITGNYVDSGMLARYAQQYRLTMDGEDVNPMEVVLRAREQYAKLDQILQATSREVSFSTAGMFRKLAPAYAFTCHKSQGGEYPVVVILLHSANSRLLSREWLYTAVTRAQKRIIIVYNQRGMMLALKNQRVKGNNLDEKIRSFVKISEEDAQNDKAILPNLPEHPEEKG
jgi:superfamily I DNA/RNA helicase